MSHSITCSTETLTLAKHHFFILVGFLCEFAMMPNLPKGTEFTFDSLFIKKM